MASIFTPNFVKIADGLAGAEGPVFTPDGTFYMVAPEVEKNGQPAGQILKIDLDNGKKTVVCEPCVQGGGIPAGCQSDREGNLYVADMRLGILVMKSDGSYSQVARADKTGRTMQGCNDCIMDNTGTLWVTAPAGSIAPDSYLRSFEEGFGSLYCLTPDKQVTLLDTGYRFCNGIAVVHGDDGKPTKLIVAETPTRLLWAYDIEGPGQVANKTKWGKLPDCDSRSGPDGMDFDDQGNLLVAHHGSGFIDVFSPAGGDPITRVKCPFDHPSNVHFRPGSSTVYVTEHTNHALWRFDWQHKGMPQYCDRM